MTISLFRSKLRRQKYGTFRLLKIGEAIEAHDVVVGHSYFDFVGSSNIGAPAEKSDTILRLEFTK